VTPELFLNAPSELRGFFLVWRAAREGAAQTTQAVLALLYRFFIISLFLPKVSRIFLLNRLSPPTSAGESGGGTGAERAALLPVAFVTLQNATRG
jgi:hypothetical protein